ncbi:DUF4242 domain-containing protein [Jannaschia seohaensis]|uniref:Uncharacterized protein DUF4242 n=1 Tax=Jannaschia seohaensis TaxID=475081 RepID=A0A2Y9B9U2_9RHOB|nr:DUF4242 domain-containing protein [Jannaschia seohaensis]PWJ10046.1 uncharacterized protein DUF4242 [Jannaschia seohaensis]SSA51797.1 Protein of unknown function [Jannaschia seohaensis]
MKKFVIEREIAGVGDMNDEEISGAAKTSNDALVQLAPKVQWIHSYVTGSKTFCIYLAESEAAIRQHAELSGFPAHVITEVERIIDPTTAERPY